ncbi:MAG: S8 family serine peptidase, partial [Lachnospiraceae bacterium]|nr:S8 family serine peptidase [Lachnospiraceae bacterium]
MIQPNYNFSLQSGTEYKESESEVLLSGNNVEKQWAIKNDGSFVSPGKYEQELHIKTVSGMDLEAPKAWELIDREGAQKHKVVVAVLDTGIDTGHEDLQNILWQNPGEKSDGIDNDGNGYADDLNGWDFAEGRSNISDSVGHGTRVAGIISARRNETGICGIAAYDEIRIMPLKVFNKKGETDTFSVIRAIQYAEKCGARICNCSWGYIRSSNPDDNDILLEQTIRQSGMLFVAASGNKGENNDDIHMIPANIESGNVLSVGSIEWDGSLSWFSNYGKTKVDLCAPGAAIISTCPSGYDYDWGTSMATPYVTGIAATMCMLRPALSNEQIRNLMLDESNLKKIEGLREYCVSGGIP